MNKERNITTKPVVRVLFIHFSTHTYDIYIYIYIYIYILGSTCGAIVIIFTNPNMTQGEFLSGV